MKIEQSDCSTWLNWNSSFSKLRPSPGPELAKGVDPSAAPLVELSGIVSVSSFSSPTSVAPFCSPSQLWGEDKSGKSLSLDLFLGLRDTWMKRKQFKFIIPSRCEFTYMLMVAFLSKSKVTAKGYVLPTSIWHFFWFWKKNEGIGAFLTFRELLVQGSGYSSLYNLI